MHGGKAGQDRKNAIIRNPFLTAIQARKELEAVRSNSEFTVRRRCGKTGLGSFVLAKACKALGKTS